MALTIFVPALLLLFMMREGPLELPWLLEHANHEKRLYEVLIALIPLVVFGLAAGFIFNGEFNREESRYNGFYTPIFVVPTLVLLAVLAIFFFYSFNYRDLQLATREFYFVSGVVVATIIILFATDGFMAASRSEERGRIRSRDEGAAASHEE